MDFMKIMQQRCSCRSFTDKPVAREDLMQIIEAGRLTPSGCNAQPWKFIVVDEAEALQKVRDALVLENGKTGCPWRDQVQAFIILCEMPAKVMPAVLEYYGTTQRFAQGDLGAACMNMCHQAMAMGLDTCILGMHDREKLRSSFGLPEEAEARLILAVGYGAQQGAVKKIRKSTEEICSFNRW